MPLANNVQSYRRFHDAVVPGVASLHRMMRAIFDTVLAEGAKILVSGAGGGRELETLGASPKNYRLVGIDPSAEMLELARSCVVGTEVETRATLIRGVPANLPTEPHDAATSLFVMHFLPDDGSKASYLHEVRRRLRAGGPYLHVDVCHEGLEAYERLAPVYKQHAEMGGLPSDDARQLVERVAGMPIISESLLVDRLHQAGFGSIAPFYRGLWYTGFWTVAE